uniref:Cytochrome c biogenesis protein CcsA n=2 Tax=Lasianthus TaxID=58410 RepID=A0A6F8FCK6_9GENT|nr:cytochrome c biogenesis protein [Lasianthus sp. Kainulaninen et al. 17]
MIFANLEHILTHISFSIVSIRITIHLISFFLVDEIIQLYDLSEGGILVTFLCLTGLLVTRWIYSGHFPLSDLYESLLFLSWSFCLIHIVPYFYLKKKKNYLSTITGSSVLFTQGFVTSGLLTEIDQSSVLVPALQSHWLIMHVTMMLLGYASLLCGSLLSIALLVITFRKTRKIFKIVGQSNLLLLNKPFLFGEIKYMNERGNPLPNTSFFSPKNYYRFQWIQQLDYWSYRVISLGFICLTIGILSGAVWANEAWGSYWNWDPKETWAFITWIIFAIYLHTRTNRKTQGSNPAIVASIGFIIIWVCYFGVNLLGKGLHSYGSFPLPLTSN